MAPLWTWCALRAILRAVDHRNDDQVVRSLRLHPAPRSNLDTRERPCDDSAWASQKHPAPPGKPCHGRGPAHRLDRHPRDGTSVTRRKVMNVDRSHVVQALRAGGRTEQARRAEKVLDVEVDTVRDADLLRELGIDPDSRAQGGMLALR